MRYVAAKETWRYPIVTDLDGEGTSATQYPLLRLSYIFFQFDLSKKLIYFTITQNAPI